VRRGLLGAIVGSIVAAIMSHKQAAATSPSESLLAEASSWLNRQNLSLMRAFALGEETRFGVNQDRLQLRLVHADGAAVELQIQILGSFNPHQGDFRWAWGNSSVVDVAKQAAIKARKFGEDRQISELTQEVLRLPFDKIVPLVALAGQASKADGIYRCINDDNLSVFVAIVGAEHALIPTHFWGNSTRDTRMEDAAVKLLNDWDAENLPIDAEFYEHNKVAGDRPAKWEDLLDQKMEIYRRYWKREDDEWEPASFGWPSDHDPKEHSGRFAIPRRKGGVFVITRETNSESAYAVEKFEERLFITDCEIGWGTGVVFASAMT
jgi:hypothetical protein